jgi:uncharacterized protein YceH (UPF0502 family)
MNLSPSEIRVLGCLLEKQRTTPDAYPLSLNALRLACNQSTNREPVVQYDEAVLRDALHRLQRRGYARLASGVSSRAAKYRHLLAEALPLGEDEHAVMCVLMLRGAQTPGELKQRTERMHSFADLGGVHETLERLIGRGLVAVLERRPGQKEERYMQLLGEEADAAAEGPPAPTTAPAPVARAVDTLEERVARLEQEVARLRAALGEPEQESGGGAELSSQPEQEGGAGAELSDQPEQEGGAGAERSEQPEQESGASAELADQPEEEGGANAELSDPEEEAAAGEILEWR